MQITERSGSSDDYRYGFNGMEKDDEVKGGGNSYDFGARMYDPRVGRWFAPDPLEKKYPHLGTYVYVANYVLNSVDRDGKDIIYLNKDGKVIKVVDDGKPVIKIVEFGSKMKKDFISYDIAPHNNLFKTNDNNRQVVANVAGFYAKSLGINRSVKIGATYEDSNSLAFTTGDKKNIYINPKDGKISPILNNKYNLISVLEHEKFHTEENEDNYTYSMHSEVYIKQMQSSNFKKTTVDFQNGIVGSLVKYIEGAKNNGENYTYLIESFNKKNITGYKLLDRSSGGIQVFNPKGEELLRELSPPLDSPH